MSETTYQQESNKISEDARDESKHWVEELFPPAFVFSWDKFLDDLETARNEKKLPPAVSPLDVSAIKNVYERVYLRNIIQEEETKRIQQDRDEKVEKELSLHEETVPVAEDRKSEDSCIWNSTELNVLREVFKTAKVQNSKYKFTIQDLAKQLEESQEKCKGLEKILKTRTNKLSEALKANQRLTIQAESCGMELTGARKRIVNLSETLTEVKTLRAQQLLDEQDLRIKCEQRKMEVRKLTDKLEKMNGEYLHDRTIREDEIKLIYEREIEFVLGRLEEMTKNYEKERDEHSRAKKALEHLRTHFSSLPDDPGIGVDKDEVSNIDYI